MIRRRALLAAVSLPLLGARGTAAAPGTPLYFLVGAAPGSTEDYAARAFAPFLARYLPGTDITMTNLPGEDGLAACQAMLRAPPDGTALLWAATPALTAACLAADQAALLDSIGFLAALRTEPIVFVATARSKLVTCADLLHNADLRGPAKPLATPPAGSPGHLAALRLQELSRTPLAIITFPSSVAARAAARGGTACAAALVLSDVIDELRAGLLIGLGLTAPTMVAGLPTIPPVAYAGVELSMTVRRGVAARPDLPQPIRQHLMDALHGIAVDPEFVADGHDNGFQVAWIGASAWAAATRSEWDALAPLWPHDPQRTLAAAQPD